MSYEDTLAAVKAYRQENGISAQNQSNSSQTQTQQQQANSTTLDAVRAYRKEHGIYGPEQTQSTNSDRNTTAAKAVAAAKQWAVQAHNDTVDYYNNDNAAYNWLVKARQQSEDSQKSVDDLKAQLTDIRKDANTGEFQEKNKNNLLGTLSKLVSGDKTAAYAEQTNLQKALDQAKEENKQAKAKMDLAQRVVDRRDAVKEVEGAVEKGASYKGVYDSYSKSLEEMNKQREQLTQQLKRIQNGSGYYGAASTYEEDKARQKADEEEVSDRLEKLEREIKRIEGVRSYAKQYLTKDAGAKAVIEQGRKLAEVADQQNSQLHEKAKEEQRQAINMAGGMAGLAYDANLRRTDRSAYRPTDQWTKGQEELFYFYFGSPDYGPEVAEDYAARLNYAYNTGAISEKTKAAETWGAGAGSSIPSKIGRGAAGIAGSIVSMPFAAADYMNKMLEVSANGRYAGRDFAMPSDYTEAVTRGRSEQLNKDYGEVVLPFVGKKGLGDVYQLTQSMAQSLALGNIVGEAATLGAFFFQAANSSFDEAMQRGANAQYAALYSALCGTAEVAFEKISLERLLADKNWSKQLVKELVSQGLVEGSEELFTSLANEMNDRIAAAATGQRPKMEQEISALVAQGMSVKDAQHQVWTQFAHDLAWDAIGGAISGFGSGAVQAGVKGTQNKLWEMRKDAVLGTKGGAHIAGKDGKATGKTGASNTSDAQLEKLLVQAEKRGELQTALFIANELINREEAGQRQRPTGDPNSTSMLAERILDGMRRNAGITDEQEPEIPAEQAQQRTPLEIALDEQEAEMRQQQTAQNAAGQQEAPAGQITQPSQQNAAQTVKPGDSEQQGHIPTWEEYKAQNNIFLQTGMKSEEQLRADYERMLKSASTTSAESGTIENTSSEYEPGHDYEIKFISPNTGDFVYGDADVSHESVFHGENTADNYDDLTVGLKTGYIRVKPGHGIELSIENGVLSAAQEKSLKKIIDDFRGDTFYVDFDVEMADGTLSTLGSISFSGADIDSRTIFNAIDREIRDHERELRATGGNNNAGEQAVQQPEETAAGELGRGNQETDGRNGDESGYSLWRDVPESAENQQGAQEANSQRLPRFVTEEDRAALSSTEESAPITKEQEEDLGTLNSVLNDGAQAVSKPKIGSRLHLAWQLAKSLNMRTLFLKNANHLSVFRRGIFGAARRGFTVIDGNGTVKEPVTLVTHESGHYKLHDRFGDIGEIANGAYKKRLSLFSEVFNNAFGVMRGLQAMSAVEKYMRQTKKYEAVYAATRNKAISQVSKILAKSGTYLSQDATSLVAEMEKASAVEEFLNQMLALDGEFIDKAEDVCGLSYNEMAALRKSLVNSYISAGVYTQDEINAINNAISALNEDNFTDDFGEETANAENSNAGDEGFDAGTNYYYDSRGSWQRVESNLRSGTGDKSTEFNLNEAVRAVQNGDVESLSNYELQKVYDYITDGLPNTSNNRLTRISNQMLNAKAANRLSSNDPKTQARLDAAYLVLNEMEARGMDTKRVPARWKFVSEAHSDSEITPETSADDIIAAIREEAEDNDGVSELEKDIMYGRGDWANYTVKERLNILENNPEQIYYDAGNDRIAKESSFGYDDEATDDWENEERLDDQFDSGETDTKREARWDARKGREYRDQLLKATDYERRKARGEATSWADAERGANYVEGLIPATENGWVGPAEISDEEYEEAKQILKESEQYDRYVSRLKSLREKLTELQNLAKQYAGSIVDRGKDARSTIRNYELAIQDYTDMMNEALETGDTNGASFYFTAADELRGMLASTREYLDYLKSKYKSSPVVGDFGVLTEQIESTKVDILAAEWAIVRMTQSARSLFADAQRAAKVAEETGSDTAKRHADELAKQARKRKNRENWAKRAVYQHDEQGKGRYNVGGEREITSGYGGIEMSENLPERSPSTPASMSKTEYTEAMQQEYGPYISDEQRKKPKSKSANGKRIPATVQPTTSDKISQRNLEAYQEAMRPGRLLKANDADAKSMDRLNRMFADRLGIENKGSTAGAIGTPKSFYDYSMDVDADTSGSSEGKKPLVVDAAYTNYAAAAQSVADLHKKIMSDIMSENPDMEEKDIDKEIEDSFLGSSVRALDTAVSQIADSKDPLGAVLNLRQQIYSAKNKGEGPYAALASDAVIGMCDEIGRLIENSTMPYDQKAEAYAVATTQLVSALSTRAERLYEAAHRVQRIQDKLATVTKKDRGKLREALTGYKIMQMNPTTLFKMLDNFDVGGKGAGYEIARALENGTVKSAELIARAARQFDEAKKVEGFQEFAEGKTMAGKLLKGEHELTELQAIEFILLARRMNGMKIYDTDAHGGVIEKTRLQTLKGFALRDADGNHVFVDSTYEDSRGKKKRFDWYKEAEAMYQSLSPAARAYLKAVNKVMDGLGKEIRQAKINATGIGFTGMEGTGYYPISYMSEKEHLPDYNTKPDYEGLSHDKHLESPRLTHGGYAVVQNAAPVVDRYVEWASNYAGFADIADMLQTMNVSGNGRGIVNATADAYGVKYGKAIERYIGDVNNFTDVSKEHTENSTLRALRQNMAAGVLGLSLSVPIKQVASYWDAAGILSMDSLRRAYRVKAFVKEKGLGAENLFLKSRQVGNVDPTVSEMVGSGLMDNLKKRSGIVKLFAEATNRMDYKTVDNLFTATVLDVEANLPGVDKNSDLFKRAVESKFNQVVLNTQPIFNKNARSEYQRSSNEWQRLFSMFRTQQTQNFNRLIVSTMEARAAKGTSLEAATKRQLRQTIAGQVAGQLEFAALTALANFVMHGWKRWRDDDDEITVESVVKRFGLDAVESIAGTAWFGDEIAKMLIDGAFGTSESFGVNMGILSSVFDTVKYFSGVVNDAVKGNPLDIFDSTRKFIGAGSSVLGLPVNNLYRLANAAVMWSLDALKWASKGKYGNRANYDDFLKMTDAWIKGGLKEEGAKKQAAVAFRKDQPENLLYNLGILSSLTAEGSNTDKGAAWLNTRIQGRTEAEREKYKADELARLGRNLGSSERIANYLADSALSAAKKDEAIDKFATGNGYNVLYESLRAAGMTPKAAVEELGKTDNKTGLSTDIRSDDSLADLYAGKDNPGETNDVPSLDKKNTDEYVNFVSAMKVFRDTGNYSQLDKLVDQYSRLDENTRAVIEAKDSTIGKYREYREMGLSTRDYYEVKDAVKQAQVELDLSSNTGSAVKLVGLSKTNLSKEQIQKLVESEAFGISKTGKTLLEVLGKYGYTTEEIGNFLYNADWSNDKSNGTLSQQEVVLALAAETRLTPAQRSAIYEELKPLLRNEYKINHWYDKSYEYELNYLKGKGATAGRAS